MMSYDVIGYDVINYDVIDYAMMSLTTTSMTLASSDYNLLVIPKAVHIHSLKHGGHKSAIDGSNQEAGDEESTGDTGTIRPAGNEEIDHKHDTESGEGECTWRSR